MASQTLIEGLKNIVSQLAGAVFQAGLFASIMVLIRPSGGGFLSYFTKALGFRVATVPGSSIPTSFGSSSASSSLSMGSSGGMSDAIQNLSNRVESLANRPIIVQTKYNNKIVTETMIRQQNNYSQSNLRVSR